MAMTDKFDPREAALAESRNRIKSSATRMMWSSGDLDKFTVDIGVQVWPGENLDMEFMNEVNFPSISDPSALADSIYEVIASRLPSRAVEITISIEDSRYAVSYKTHP
jgi:hypothetical protein